MITFDITKTYLKMVYFPRYAWVNALLKAIGIFDVVRYEYAHIMI